MRLMTCAAEPRPYNMAPEQLVSREVTARSDIYALGLVLFELSTGKWGFEGNTYDEVVHVTHFKSETSPERGFWILRRLLMLKIWRREWDSNPR